MRHDRRRPYVRYPLKFLTGLCLAACGLVVGQPPVRAEGVDSTQVRDVTPRSPRRAMVRSLLVPGWGQFYNGKFVKGVLLAAAETGSVAAFFVRRNQLADEPVVPGAPPRRNIYLFTTIGVLFYSAVDAYVDAHLDGVDWGNLKVDARGARFEIGKTFGAGEIGLRVIGWAALPGGTGDARVGGGF